MYAERKEDNWYEIILEVADSKNFELAIVNLSKTVDIDYVEVLEDGKLERQRVKTSQGKDVEIFIPVYTISKKYSWGIING